MITAIIFFTLGMVVGILYSQADTYRAIEQLKAQHKG